MRHVQPYCKFEALPSGISLIGWAGNKSGALVGGRRAGLHLLLFVFVHARVLAKFRSLHPIMALDERGMSRQFPALLVIRSCDPLVGCSRVQGVLIALAAPKLSSRALQLGLFGLDWFFDPFALGFHRSGTLLNGYHAGCGKS